MPTETGSVPPDNGSSLRQEQRVPTGQGQRASAGQSVPERLAEQFKSLGVARTYGEPLQVGGDTVVPVAMVQYGFGGGDSGGAAGGGGGGMAIPLGAYIGNGTGPATFRPNTVALFTVLIPLVWITGRALARVVRAAKK